MVRSLIQFQLTSPMPANTKLTIVSCPQFRLQNRKLADTPVEIMNGAGIVVKVITLAQFLKVLNSSAKNWELEITTEEKQP